MHPYKMELIHTIIDEIKLLCSNEYVNESASIQSPLRLTDEQLQDLIFKIVISLPDKLIYLSDERQIRYYVKLIASEFVLFQVNEDLANPSYPILFSNFINELNSHLIKKSPLR
ncbi:hypothetical protein [Legionella waltersii]|uniref:Uncharacterized protein n=1 Tax=Legionella waltersii TaxID=66969 RepID=A0A0W1AAT1_9GAMM|nr:hypothetical protein [Legionella waltersii]KTD78469.1 hypothetical protein Lwal_1904 [Legionella waltersii]SNV05888.1 Uncharacterised protein [Legionella waltersii]